MKIGIIGAGASGMAAALSASVNPDNQIVLLERQARVGRKLLATGNGRCNLTNIYASGSAYHGTDSSFAEFALGAFSPEKTLNWFSEMGLYTVTEESGKVYPYSDQANSVVDVLRLSLEKTNVNLITGFDVQKIKKLPEGFSVSDGEETVVFDKLIIACGGLAGSKLGGTMSGYKLLGKLGHKSTKLRPALVQLKSDWGSLPALKGIRTESAVSIYHNGTLFAQNRGQLQFTEYGISGPVVFEVSRDVCAQPGQWICKLDMIPDWSEDMLMAALKRKAQSHLPVQELLTGILHNRLGRVLTQSAGLSMNGLCRDLHMTDLQAVVKAVKSFEITITEPMGMDSAQVTAGGVLTEQFCPETMESRLVPGLYACGEVLDIDGDCGGFNLQWAWSSGYLAGQCAGGDGV